METHKDKLYDECLVVAKEVICDREFPDLDRDPYTEGKFSHPTLQEYFGNKTDIEIINLAQSYIIQDVEENDYRSDLAREIDIEWLEAFLEWRDIYNERVIAQKLF